MAGKQVSMETIQSEQFTIDGNKDPSVKESLFYMNFLLTIYPMIMGLLSDYFSLQHLSETDISTMGITGSIDTLTTAMSAVFAIGAQAVCAKYVGSRDEKKSSEAYTSILLTETGILLAFLYPHLADLFLGDIGANRDMILYHADYFLICTCIGLPFYVRNNIFTSIYEVREMLAHAHVSYFLEIFGMVTIYSLALGTLIGIKGVWIAYPLAEATVFVLNIVLLILHTRGLPRRWLDLSFPKQEVAEKGNA